MSKIIIENLSKMHISRSDMIKSGFSAQKYDDVCRGRSSYKIDDLIRISEKFQLSLDFLVKGEKTQYNVLSEYEKNLLDTFNKLCKEDKIRISERAETLAELAAERAAQEEQGKTAALLRGDKPAVPKQFRLTASVIPADSLEQNETEDFYIDICNLPASAGTGVYLDDIGTEPLRIAHTRIAERANYAVRVSGDSMTPKYDNGDIVLVETCPSVAVGEIGIFIVDGEGFIKKFGGDCLISLNPKYKDRPLKDYESVYCRGRVLGKAELL